jgi:phage/plasmid-like protein (TIGR03299 family)
MRYTWGINQRKGNEMPALIDSFASRAEVAWHGLGTVFDKDENVNTAKMVTLAGLDWTVGLEPLVTDGGLTTDAFATVRTNKDGSKGVLGVVGQRYHVVQNADALAFADNILDGGGRWETAGGLKDGAVVFGSMAVLNDIVIDPNGASDKIKTYLLINTSHDGSSAVQVSTTPVRVVCSNTLNMALKGTKNTIKFRHTQSVEGKVLHARQSLGMATTYFDAFEKEAQELFATAVTNNKFDAIIKALYPEPDAEAKGATTRWDNRRDRLFDLWNGPTNANIANTGWAAFNALTEENQWYRQVRSGNLENGLAAGAGFDDATNRFRTDALNAVKALV